MNAEPKFRYYPVKDPFLEVLRAYQGELDATIDDRDKLEAEFAERARQQAEYHQANLRSMWRRLSASVGLDPDLTWGSPEYQIEARYLDDGFGAILYVPRHENPLQGMLRGIPVGQPSDPAIDIPPKEVTRH